MWGRADQALLHKEHPGLSGMRSFGYLFQRYMSVRALRGAFRPRARPTVSGDMRPKEPRAALAGLGDAVRMLHASYKAWALRSTTWEGRVPSRLRGVPYPPRGVAQSGQDDTLAYLYQFCHFPANICGVFERIAVDGSAFGLGPAVHSCHPGAANPLAGGGSGEAGVA